MTVEDKIMTPSGRVLPEDNITNALINQAEGETAVEVFYNNYGSRGYVDLVQNRQNSTFITEIKSKPESANSVIRQFNKMKNNFVQGTDYDEIKPRKIYWLVFTASRNNILHLINNSEMYLTIEKQPNTQVSIADKTGYYIPVFSDGKIQEKTFSELKGITENLKDVEEEQDKICPICGKRYEMESYYKKHVQECFE